MPVQWGFCIPFDFSSREMISIDSDHKACFSHLREISLIREASWEPEPERCALPHFISFQAYEAQRERGREGALRLRLPACSHYQAWSFVKGSVAGQKVLKTATQRHIKTEPLRSPSLIEKFQLSHLTHRQSKRCIYLGIKCQPLPFTGRAPLSSFFNTQHGLDRGFSGRWKNLDLMVMKQLSLSRQRPYDHSTYNLGLEDCKGVSTLSICSCQVLPPEPFLYAKEKGGKNVS